MSDFKPHDDARSLTNPLFLQDEELRQGMDILFSVWRIFLQKTDDLLTHTDLGRTHYYALFFIRQHADLSIYDLLNLMKITRQSLNRILNHLLKADLIFLSVGRNDRRKRILHLSGKGEALESEITAAQSSLFAQAYRESGAESVRGFHHVLHALLESATEPF